MTRPRLVIFLLINALAVLETTYHYLDFVARGNANGRFLQILIEEFSSCYGVLFLLPLIFWAADAHKPLRYLFTLLTYSALHTTWNWAVRSLLFLALDQGPYDYGRIGVRYAMEFPIDTVGFAVIVFLRRQYLLWQRSRQLEAALAEARMELLTRQLQPHFLFNSLNTISALMREDLDKAELILNRLGEFLRATIDLRNATTIPLSQELQLLHSYIAIMQARFEEKLQFEASCPAGLHPVPVPPLFLQPLVENAINHGRNPQTGIASITLHLASNSGNLRCTIQDNGPGPASGKTGFGLDAVRQRLGSIYGQRASLELAANHGTLVTVEFPLC